MRFAGRTLKVGKFWAVEVPLLGVASQGHTRQEAIEMIADAVESLVNKKGFKLSVFPGDAGRFEVGSDDQATLISFLLRRLRQRERVSLAEAARRLGSTSVNSYARYEQGSSVPSAAKLFDLLSAVAGGSDFVIEERPRHETVCRTPRKPRRADA
ncbi:MAG: type II toxin-antitoxin system HicB family antitoxin, partial [Deltaproteobacteria bacterium]|nr:type II toxin-antitoxin system HicB family antitoxin [Deltaproteobacteria bacterium]